MVDVTPIIPEGRQVVETYGDGRFRISGVVHHGSVIVLPHRTLAWPVSDWGELDVDAFAPLLDAEDADVGVLLLGCGSRMQLISRALRSALRVAGIVVEPMDTGAACGT
jgi:uncharacterized protein